MRKKATTQKSTLQLIPQYEPLLQTTLYAFIQLMRNCFSKNLNFKDKTSAMNRNTAKHQFKSFICTQHIAIKFWQ